MTFARTKEEGVKAAGQAEAREDVILATPALHAALLGFFDPVREKPVEFTAPLHEPMRSLVRRLREHRLQDAPCATSGFFIDLDAAVPE